MENSRITTLIFDVDDTLYDVGTGFTAHRNGEIVQKFMVDELNFPDQASVRSGRVARVFRALCWAQCQFDLPHAYNKIHLYSCCRPKSSVMNTSKSIMQLPRP